MTASQLRFLALHKHHVVVEWRNIFGGSNLRATTDRGRSATIAVSELDDLMARGLMTSGHGFGMALTELGKTI